MKTRKMTKKELSQIEIDVQSNGFTVWIREGKHRHWIVDGSMMKKDGEIQLGQFTQWKKFAEFDSGLNAIRLVHSNEKRP